MTPSIVYRPAVEADFPIVARMCEQMLDYLRRYTFTLPEVENAGELWLNTYRRTLGRFTIIFVAEVDGQVMSFLSARLKQTPAYMGGVMVGELMEVWVEPGVRRYGIGEKLTRLAIEWLQEKGAQSVEVQILVDNEPSINMVKGLGMKPELFQLRLNWADYKALREE